MTVEQPDIAGTVQRAMAVVDAVGPLLLDRTERADIDAISVTGRLERIDDVDVSALLALPADGHVVEIRVGDREWSLLVRGDSAARPIIEPGDRPELALSEDRAEDLARAAARSDAPAALAAVAGLPAELFVRLQNDPAVSGAHWVASERALSTLLESQAWIAAATALAAGPAVLVVGDWLAEELVTDGLRICGSAPGKAVDAARRGDGAWLAAPVPTDGRTALPSPAVFAGAAGTAPADRPDGGVGGLLQGLARCLSWYWLASDVRIDPDGSVAATVLGARTVSLRLVPARAADAAADVGLFAWAYGGSDPGRLEAARQAASLALVTDRDLPTAAGPALRTARSLYELARRGAISEALAARRSARDAALAAAQQAAAAARQASGKAVERVVLQTGALGAIVLARASGLAGPALAVLLALLVAALSAAAWAVTSCVELPSATNGLRAELDDLEQYRDTLSLDDVAAVQGIQSAVTAAADLKTSRRTVHCVYGAAVLASLFAAVVLAFVGPDGTAAPASVP